MQVEVWATFVAASAVVLLVPGPSVMTVVACAVGRDGRAALLLALGATAGQASLIVLAFAGVGAVLASSAALFAGLQLGGAAWLCWLGAALWREVPDAGGPEAGARGLVAASWAATALSPVSLGFHAAFLPQFIDPVSRLGPQVAVLAPTFLAMTFGISLAFGLLAARARQALRSPGAARLCNRAGGAALMGLAGGMAVLAV